MRIVIAGSSGFVGHTLAPALRAAGHQVHRLVRRPASGADEITWNPAAGQLDSAALADVDAVINLAGENIAAGRWTDRRRTALVRSRIDATRTLVDGLARTSARPGRVLVNASATGFYGDRGDELLDEQSACGAGFLAGLCRDWEAAATHAETAGFRVVCLRLGIVLAPAGGALAKMLPAFRAGLGGRIGSGRQWMSWVHRDDVIGAIMCAVTDARARGAVNVVAPDPVTNRDFTATLAAELHRPAWLPVPAWALRLALGAMADEALLASTRVAPVRLTNLGYAFEFPTLRRALRAAVGT